MFRSEQLNSSTDESNPNETEAPVEVAETSEDISDAEQAFRELEAANAEKEEFESSHDISHEMTSEELRALKEKYLALIDKVEEAEKKFIKYDGLDVVAEDRREEWSEFVDGQDTFFNPAFLEALSVLHAIKENDIEKAETLLSDEIKESHGSYRSNLLYLVRTYGGETGSKLADKISAQIYESEN